MFWNRKGHWFISYVSFDKGKHDVGQICIQTPSRRFNPPEIATFLKNYKGFDMVIIMFYKKMSKKEFEGTLTHDKTVKN